MSGEQPNSQKRQHSSSYNMPQALKRPVGGQALVDPEVSSPALTSAPPSALPPQTSPQLSQPQFRSGFTLAASPVPKGKRFSQMFVNATYKKPGTPEIAASPSVQRAKLDTASYIDEPTDANDFDTNSLAYTQPTVSYTVGPSRLAQLPNPMAVPAPVAKREAQLTKELTADSPGSTISDASHTAQTLMPHAEPALTRLSEEEQTLITKLQDTYKNITRLEVILQRRCTQLNVPPKLDRMNELWDVYNINTQLLNSYYDFLLYAFGSGKSGKQIVQVYRIPRRLWVYGIVTFLDVIKNVVSIFIEHDICSSFIGYAFVILSGLSDLDMDGWVAEKLGDLSRMAIALYPSRYIDWTISSEYWYTQAMKTQYGCGKIYYHVATVQQDSLDALMNIGKSVFCRDTFVPTPQYMKMVIDNINQRSYIDLPVLDFTKVYKLLLTGEVNDVYELNKLITFYTQNLGVDNNNVDFFTRVPGSLSEVIVSPDYSQDNDYEGKFQFWLQRSSSFALANISLMAGFGVPSNPFARLFRLLEALKERKDRKEKKDKRKKSSSGESMNGSLPHIDREPTPLDEIPELSVEEWFSTHAALDKVVVKLTMKMFDTYLKGPVIAALPHVITMLYFIVAVGKATKLKPKSRAFFETVMNMFLPSASLINYLNDVLSFIRSKPEILESLAEQQVHTPNFLESGFLNHYNQNETLVEVWKCWGTLWYDVICLKEEFCDSAEAGIAKHDLLDIPIGGARYDQKMNKERFTRVILLATYIADNFNFGIKRGSNGRFFNHVESIMEKNALSTEADSYVKQTYMELAQQAKALGLIETSFAEKSGARTVRDDILKWLSDEQAQQAHVSGQVVNYADDEADNEESEEYFEHSDYGDGAELEDIGRDILADASSVRHPSPGVITAESGIMVGKDVTFFILDTNMWLKHCGKLFKALRSRIFKLAIPLVVFQELRSLRCSREATVSDAATRAVIALRQLGTEGLLVPLKMDGTQAPSLNDVADFEGNTSWLHNIDETIIKSTKLLGDHLQNMVQSTNNYDLSAVSLTVLITEDRAMRLSSRVNKVAAFQGKWFFQVVEKLAEGKCND